MPDILLIQPPIRDFYLTAKRTIPYGLTCIASALIESGYSVDILDALATSKARVRDLPEQMSYLRQYYPQPDRSPFALFRKKSARIRCVSGGYLIFIHALHAAGHSNG